MRLHIFASIQFDFKGLWDRLRHFFANIHCLLAEASEDVVPIVFALEFARVRLLRCLNH